MRLPQQPDNPQSIFIAAGRTRLGVADEKLVWVQSAEQILAIRLEGPRIKIGDT
jgi:hypothetical protein